MGTPEAGWAVGGRHKCRSVGAGELCSGTTWTRRLMEPFQKAAPVFSGGNYGSREGAEGIGNEGGI